MLLDAPRRWAVRRLLAGALMVSAALTGPLTGNLPAPSAVVPSPLVAVVVSTVGKAEGAERAVARLGGHVVRRYDVIDGFAAKIPRGGVDALAARTDVTAVTPDARMRALHAPDAGAALGPTSMFHVNDTIGAKPMWKAGWSGQGVDVAVVDTGVVPVDGLTAPGKVVNGPDVSFETGVPALRHLDSYGHGTHMAGIIAGRDDSVSSPVKTLGHDRFTGVAPDARIVNVKVADASGGTDVSQVIAGIDWVVQNRTSNGLNIRVLNLSFGTDGLQSYLVDPLAHAVETAWHRGLVVVVSAGNADYGNARLDNPALDPYVIAVGGADSVGTVEPADDRLAAWSSQGDDRRRPDLLAPGQSVVSLRSPGSHLDQMAPGARVDGRFLRGSGTSQAAAVVSGAAALLLQQRPGLSPDQVKALMTASARKLANADTPAAGAGLLDVAAAGRAATPVATQQWPRSLGTGSLDLARGTARVTLDGQPLVGEVTVFGTVWDGAGWAAALAGATTWSGGSWSGNSWSGNSWSGGSWSGNSWSGNSWSGNSWSGGSWSGNSWSGNSWSGNSWSGNSWSGNSWSSAGWPGG